MEIFCFYYVCKMKLDKAFYVVKKDKPVVGSRKKIYEC